MLCSGLLSAQGRVDSLLSVLSNQTNDSSSVYTMLALSEAYTLENTELSFEYANKARKVSESTHFEIGIIESEIALGFIFLKRGKLDTAIYFFEKSIKESKYLNYQKGIVGASTGKGDVFRERTMWEEAIVQYEIGIEIAEILNDKLAIAESYLRIGHTHLDRGGLEQAMVYYQKSFDSFPENLRIKLMAIGNIGLIHLRLRNEEKALEHFLESIRLAEQIDSKRGIGLGNQRIGIIEKRKGNYKKSMAHYSKAIEMFRQVNDLKRIGMVLQNIGNIHYELGEFDRAIEKHKESLVILKEVGDKVNQCYTLDAIGRSFFLKKEYVESEKYFVEAKVLSETAGVRLIAMDATDALAEIYALNGNYEKAFEYGYMARTISDSIFSENKSRQIAEMEAKYETSKKEKEIALLNAESKINELQLQRRSTERNSWIITAIALLILATVLFNRYKIKAKANEGLRQIDEMKSRFFTNISHEFRTPLTLILGPVENRLAHDDLPVAYEGELLLIKQSADRLLELVNQLLDLSKLEVGQMELKVRKGDFYHFLKLAASSFDSLASQKNIDLSIGVPDESLELFFDLDKCKKVIYNLLSNALKFTPEGGKVKLNVERGDDMLRVSIMDSGPGIPLDQKENIFKRFHQLNESNYEQGTGIGLALVKELASIHYGNVSLESVLGEGTTFFFELPLSPKSYNDSEISRIDDGPHSMPEITHQTTHDLIPEKEGSNEAYVLIVEDNKEVRKYIVAMLSSSYKLIVANNGKEGLKLAFKHIPDLIISDLMMPLMGGMEFCQTLKKEEKTSHIPFIMLTAKADIGNKIEGLETGADDYLIKPFNEKELKTRIKNLINQRAKLRGMYERHLTLEPSKVALTPPDEIFLERAMKVLEENMEDCDFTVDLFQREMAMSRMQLHRKLKALISCSASEFIRVQRLKRASKILETKGINVSEAAFKSGFNSLSYFSKCFKEQYGLSPSEYADRQH